MSSTANSVDLHAFLEQIEKLIQDLELKSHEKAKNMTKEEEIDLLNKIKKLQEGIAFFSEFNNLVMKELGVTPAALAEQFSKKEKGGTLDRFFKKSEELKTRLFLAHAHFLRGIYDEMKKSPLFSKGKLSPEVQKSQKKKLQQRFKSMYDQLKWKKM